MLNYLHNNNPKKPAEFQRIFNIKGRLWVFFERCFLESKPFDFCSEPSLSVRKIQIKGFAADLERFCEIFIVENDGEIDFFIAVQNEGDKVLVYFIFGRPFSLKLYFRDFRKFYQSRFPQICEFYSIIRRKTKRNSFLKAIQKREPLTKIRIDNGELIAYWLLDNEK